MPYVVQFTVADSSQSAEVDFPRATDFSRLRDWLGYRLSGAGYSSTDISRALQTAKWTWKDPSPFNNTPLDNSRLEQLCAVIDLINTAAARALSKFLRKLFVLQRLAAILELSGDLVPLPDISGLIPTIAIDLEAYRRLRNACPMLNLPPVESLDELTGLADLQRQVLRAYAELDSFLNDHPWNRAGWLQEKAAELLDKIVGPVVEATIPFFQLMECFQEVCSAAAQLSLVPADTVKQVEDYWKRLEAAPDQAWGALSESAQQKYGELKQKREQLRVLAPELNPIDFSNTGLGLDSQGNPVSYNSAANGFTPGPAA